MASLDIGTILVWIAAVMAVFGWGLYAAYRVLAEGLGARSPAAAPGAPALSVEGNATSADAGPPKAVASIPISSVPAGFFTA